MKRAQQVKIKKIFKAIERHQQASEKLRNDIWDVQCIMDEIKYGDDIYEDLKIVVDSLTTSEYVSLSILDNNKKHLK